MLTKAEFLETILKINPKYNTELIGRAFDVAQNLHAGQFRKSGEPYFIHPVNVALVLTEMGMDDATIVGGLLHDVVEDTDYEREQLVEDFGEEIAVLVDGVTKLGSIKFESKEEIQAENFRKMFLAMSKDIRVLIIKLADRLHNMRTMQYMKPEKIIEKCRETLEIYAPLASRLGIFTVKFELEDLALQYLKPEEFQDLKIKINKKKEEREATINHVIEEIKESISDMDIHFDIYGRAKHYYSIYRKMKYQHKQLDEIFDLIAVRVIVDSVRDCYAVLGIVHTMWKPIPGRFKDYIAMPKPNMYQSLHTTVIGDNGEPFEIQIRTVEMHNVAEYGIAAHWKYKEGNTSKASTDDLKLAWLRQSLEWQNDLSDPKEFLETMKMDLFASQVFVFTPKGEVIELPVGSTPLDFAFKIHSAIGYKCVGAKVNGKMVTIDYTLQNGEIVEIVTSANSTGPSVDWLQIAKSSNARNKIRSWLKKENKSDNIEKGKEALNKSIKKKTSLEPSLYTKQSFLNKAMKQMNFANMDECYSQLSNGGTLLSKFTNLLISYYNEENNIDVKSNEDIIEEIKKAEARKEKAIKRKKDNPGIVVKGADNLMIKLAKCCNPVPGDGIIGFITKGRGISVHRLDCSNIIALPEAEKARFIDVEWEDLKAGKAYNTDVCIIAADRKGILSDISKMCEDMDIHLSGVNARTSNDGSISMTITLSISSTQEIQKVLRSLRNIPGVTNVYRSRA